MLFREIIDVYFERHMEALKTLYWQSAETVIVGACGTGRNTLGFGRLNL